jgi:uncharacterized protein (TIGR03435 family)
VQPHKVFIITNVFLIGSGFGSIYGQAGNSAPEFEIASVKPSQSGAPGIRIDAQRLTMNNLTLFGLISQAYGIQAFQIVGGPKWINTERFDVAAVSAQPATKEQLLTMLQALLAERFQLHFERRIDSLPGYFLVQAKGEGKLTPAKPDRPAALKTYFGTKDGHTVTQSLTFENEPISELALMLTRRLQRTVVDRTGRQGEFDFVLEYETEDPAAQDKDGFSVRSLFTAIQDQLGLKLETSKVPIEVFVIESAATPSQN